MSEEAHLLRHRAANSLYKGYETADLGFMDITPSPKGTCWWSPRPTWKT